MNQKKKQFIFICGTDTAVGKTFITGAICAYLQSEGVKAGAYKPLESGNGGDAAFLKKIAGMKEDLKMINPYYFKEPLAPGVAALRCKRKVSFDVIVNNLKKLQKNYDLILIEGAGGLLVPIQGKLTNLDLIKYLKTPVLVIARLGLGTINHTLLTLEHLKRNRVKVLGVILNQTTPRKTIADKTNPGVLKKYDVPLLGTFPYVK